jgi:hypothetical protein
MSAWTEQRVLDATAPMEFVPEGAIEVLTGDYRLLRCTRTGCSVPPSAPRR